ncbi:hypothetical protein TSUD_120050 [Trifolium subterraneum]|uniref:F-box domain-containing protein n=1 Tax=Trifolium subterraneum TaxID=3900 RepID=A0A1B5Z7B8_TRISU|nr:hypothetical protein TSUD_120050 [Trifolium subterraneum]
MKRGTNKRIKKKNEDRFSCLPDYVLLHILSFFNAKEAVQTCILSTRWKNLWKILPTLTLISSHFATLEAFTKFISKILSLRDASAALDVLDFQCEGRMDLRVLKRILTYAISHSVKRLRIDVNYDIHQFLPSLFSCHTLTSLNLSIGESHWPMTLFPNSLNLPAVTNLTLKGFLFCVGDNGRVDPFSKFDKLDTLMLYGSCEVHDRLNLCISSTTLVNLTIQTNYSSAGGIRFQLYTPNLCNFVYRGHIPFQKLCGRNSNLSSIKHVLFDVTIDVGKGSNPKDNPMLLLDLLVELANVESLTITHRTLKVLSLVPYLLEIEFPSLFNLKSLKVDAEFITEGMLYFLLQNAPSTKVILH